MAYRALPNDVVPLVLLLVQAKLFFQIFWESLRDVMQHAWLDRSLIFPTVSWLRTIDSDSLFVSKDGGLVELFVRGCG